MMWATVSQQAPLEKMVGLKNDGLSYLDFGNFSGAMFVKLREGTFLRVGFCGCPGGTKSRINLWL